MSGERSIERLELPMPDGAVIRGVIHLAETSERVPSVVFAHGFGSTRNGEKAAALATECARRGWNFAACDFRGHGESDGTMLELRGSRLLEDLDLVTSVVAEHTHGPLCLVGSSMGGWAAAWFAALSPARVAACAFVAPSFRFLEWRRLTDEEREAWQRTGRHHVRNQFVDVEVGYGLLEEAPAFDVHMLALHCRTPLIIFHGLQDEFVPYDESVWFAARCAATEVEVRLSKRGDHRMNLCKEQIAREACNFFAAYY